MVQKIWIFSSFTIDYHVNCKVVINQFAYIKAKEASERRDSMEPRSGLAPTWLVSPT